MAKAVYKVTAWLKGSERDGATGLLVEDLMVDSDEKYVEGKPEARRRGLDLCRELEIRNSYKEGAARFRLDKYAVSRQDCWGVSVEQRG